MNPEDYINWSISNSSKCHSGSSFNSIIIQVQLPNLSTSDHVVVLVILLSFTNVITSADLQVYHWSHAPWQKIHHYFSSFGWDIPNSVDAAVSFVTNAIVSTMHKFVPTCVTRISPHTPRWNHDCEMTWKCKLDLWKNGNSKSFCQELLLFILHSSEISSYLCCKLQWWSLLASLSGCSSEG